MKHLFFLAAWLLLTMSVTAQTSALNSRKSPVFVHKASPSFLSDADKLKYLATKKILPGFVDPASTETGFGHGATFGPTTFETNSIWMRLTGINQLDLNGCLFNPDGGIELLIDRIQTSIEVPIVMIEVNIGVNMSGSLRGGVPAFLVHDNKTNITQTIYPTIPAGSSGTKLIFTMPAQDTEFIFINCINLSPGSTWQFYNLQLTMITKFK